MYVYIYVVGAILVKHNSAFQTLKEKRLGYIGDTIIDISNCRSLLINKAPTMLVNMYKYCTQGHCIRSCDSKQLLVTKVSNAAKSAVSAAP